MRKARTLKDAPKGANAVDATGTKVSAAGVQALGGRA